MTNIKNSIIIILVTKIISSVTFSDIARIVELDRASFPDPWSVDSYISEVKNPCSVYLAYRSGGYIVAFSGLWIDEDCHLVTICTDLKYRRQGIGEELLSENIKVASFRGGKTMSLEVREKNIPARALYEKFGFLQVGFRPNYYHDNGDNAIIYLLELL